MTTSEIATTPETTTSALSAAEEYWIQQDKMRNHVKRKTLETLKAARKRLTDIGWTQKVMARNHVDLKIDPTDPTAVGYCALGAMYAHMPPNYNYVASGVFAGISYLNIATSALHKVSTIYKWQDGEGVRKEDVLEVFDEAISYVENDCFYGLLNDAELIAICKQEMQDKERANHE